MLRARIRSRKISLNDSYSTNDTYAPMVTIVSFGAKTAPNGTIKKKSSTNGNDFSLYFFRLYITIAPKATMKSRQREGEINSFSTTITLVNQKALVVAF